MEVHYINILIFALALNILVYNQRNHKSITRHTPNEKAIKTHRSLCECKLFSPQNYDNDPEMKSVMKDFDRKTSQRFREYDERMIKNRQKCKDECDRDIHKIILKDKIEKELKEKLAKLETNITIEDLPTCECEKSVAHKMEKTCLGCGGVLGSGIAPNVGLFGGVAINSWKTMTLKAAIKAALEAAAADISAAANAAGIQAGKNAVIDALKHFGVENFVPDICEQISRASHYNELKNFAEIIIKEKYTICSMTSDQSIDTICETFDYNFGMSNTDSSYGVLPKDAIPQKLNGIVAEATEAADIKAAEVTTIKTLAVETAEKEAIEAASTQLYSAVGYSVLAILIIVLIMVIIYLILRYRRKKKMKKKLEYIKLLEE
ncbi:rifin [Plasmodium sp. gorilla clade G1]|nr:rifin [Plasmodium sp. gorilla clade G1]